MLIQLLFLLDLLLILGLIRKNLIPLVTLNADGNVMILLALHNATQYVKDQNVKFTAKKLLVLLAKFTVISLNAT